MEQIFWIFHSPVAFRRHQLLQLLQTLLRSILLHEGHRHDDYYGDGYADGVVKLFHAHADQGGAQQQQNQRILELFNVFLPRRILVGGVQLVVADNFGPALRLHPAQSRSSVHSQPAGHLVGRQRRRVCRGEQHVLLEAHTVQATVVAL